MWLCSDDDDLEHFISTLRAGPWIYCTWISACTSSFQLPYKRHSSSANCARELFKGSNR